MYPFLFEIFGFKVYSYGMVMVIAFIICITLTLKYLPRDLLSSQDVYNFCLIIMGSLLFGTKLMEMVAYGDFNRHTLLNLLKFWEQGSFSFFPAFLLAVVLIFIYCRLKKIPLLKVMDYLLPIAILGVAIQRCFGCFLAGCCFGKPTGLPWGMVFPEASRAGMDFPGTPLHPTQLYYGITALLIYIFLVRYKKHAQNVGEITGLGFMMLAASYFFITFLRGDISPDQFFYHISRSQYLALVLFSMGFLIRSFCRGSRCFTGWFSRKELPWPPEAKERKRLPGGTMKKKLCIVLITIVCLLVSSYVLGNNNIATSNQGSKKITLADKDLGSKSNPVKCDSVKGEEAYLKKLQDMKGKSVTYERIGHVSSATGHILDKFEIKSGDGKVCVVVYMDMYCPGHTETRPIKGFKMDTSSTASPQKNGQSKKSPKQQSTLKQDSKIKPPKSKSITGSKQSSPQKKLPQKFPDDKIPGFDDLPDPPKPKQSISGKQDSAAPATHSRKRISTDKIPGFDDLPDPPRTIGTVPETTDVQANKTYLSLVPISYKSSKKKTAETQFLTLINLAFTDALKQLEKDLTASLFINQENHTIHDKKQEFKSLHTICSRKEDKTQKIETLTKKILEPQQIDLVIAGTFRLNKKKKEYTVTPIIVSKRDKKLLINKEFVYDSKMKHDMIQKDFKEKIIKLIQEEFPMVIAPSSDDQKLANIGNRQTKENSKSTNTSNAGIYISFIPLGDPSVQSKKEPKSLPELLDEVITKGVKSVEQKNRQLAVNEANHTIHDDDATVKNLSDILFKSKLRDNQKAEKIINEIMIPSSIDIIFTTHHTEDRQNKIVIVRPYVISKLKKKIFSINLIFQREELVCKQPKSQLSMICRTADDNIASAVQALVEQAVK